MLAARKLSRSRNIKRAYALGEVSDDVAEGNGESQQSLRQYITEAARGDAESMSRVGILCAQAVGVPQDFVAALAWYERAARNGSGAALENLATMY